MARSGALVDAVFARVEAERSVHPGLDHDASSPDLSCRLSLDDQVDLLGIVEPPAIGVCSRSALRLLNPST